jgi:hypothetical protein
MKTKYDILDNTLGLDKGPRDYLMDNAKGRLYSRHGRRCRLMSLNEKKKKAKI